MLLCRETSPGSCGDVAGKHSEDSGGRMETFSCAQSDKNGEKMARTKREEPSREFFWMFGGCCFLGRARLGWRASCFAEACPEAVLKFVLRSNLDEIS